MCTVCVQVYVQDWGEQGAGKGAERPHLQAAVPGIFPAAPFRSALHPRCHSYSDVTVELCPYLLLMSESCSSSPGTFRTAFIACSFLSNSCQIGAL